MITPRPTQGDSTWFVHDRFGLFVHWGLYAIPARGEWGKSREETPDERYQTYFEHFNPVYYDPREWARTARAAGMRYAVLVSKHHEGFCMWDSAFTDYKVTNTPCGRDVLAEFVEAFRAEGLRIGFYYSLIDWHHPDFPIDGIHPQRNLENAAELNKTRHMPRYAEYVRNQVRELLTRYGQIDILWCDFSYPDSVYRGLHGKGRADWESEKLAQMIRTLQPKILLNDRMDLPEATDFYTPEQVQPQSWLRVDGEPVVWEACQTFSGAWGYHRDEDTWKSPGQLIRMLVSTVACGGNLLMNVGPTALGTWDPRALRALAVYRDWMALHSEAIYGCTQSEFTAPPDCRLTQNGSTLYVHIFAWPFRTLLLDGLAGKVEFAQFLHDGSEVAMSDVPDSEAEAFGEGDDRLLLKLPVKQPDVVVPVIKLTLK